jgi:hypothetical protein
MQINNLNIRPGTMPGGPNYLPPSRVLALLFMVFFLNESTGSLLGELTIKDACLMDTLPWHQGTQ